MRLVTAILIIALIGLQYKLWFGDVSVTQWLRVEKKLVAQEQDNHKLIVKNRALEADVYELNSGEQSLEEQARFDFGMVKDGESYYQFVE